jgi:hypothetical protein
MTIPSDSVPFPGATPRPWRVIRPDSNGCEVCPEIWADRKWVATVTGAPHLGFNESLPNAALIVAAVNSHEPLTKERDALRTERDHCCGPRIDQLRRPVPPSDRDPAGA